MPDSQTFRATNQILRPRALDALFHKLIESAAVGMALVGGSGRLAYANRAYAEMFGYEGEECIGLSLHDLLHGSDAGAAADQIEELSRGEIENYRAERRFRRKDGSLFWGLISGSVVRDERTGRPIYTTVQITDITSLKAAEAELSDEKEKLRITLQSITDGVISTDGAGRVTFINPTAEALTGWRLNDALGRLLDEVFAIIDAPTGQSAPNLIHNSLSSGGPSTPDGDVCLLSRNGGQRYVRQSVAPVKTARNEVIGSVLVFQDVTASRQRHEQLAYSAAHDGLTGLTNRTAFEARLKEVFEQAHSQNREHALCFIDLDHFKAVNDTAGHAAGDALLQLVATTIRQVSRSQDIAARFGGDEFALLLMDCRLESAKLVAQKIVQAIANLAFSWQGQVHRTGASIGVTGITARSTTPSALVSEADAACYSAKNSGRNQVVLFGRQHSMSGLGSAAAVEYPVSQRLAGAVA